MEEDGLALTYVTVLVRTEHICLTDQYNMTSELFMSVIVIVEKVWWLPVAANWPLNPGY